MAYRIEGKDIVLSGFENGIADSIYAGAADMRNVELLAVPGEASVALGTSAVVKPPTLTAVPFTADEATDRITIADTTGLYPGVAIELNTLVGASLTYLIQAGGGAGGFGDGGGGGGGAGRTLTGSMPIAAGTYPIVIGDGGVGRSDLGNGANGEDTTALGLTAQGGGGGGAGNMFTGHGAAGSNGGSGGGGGGSNAGAPGSAGGTAAGAGGNAGGVGGDSLLGGGGGGSAAAGVSGNSTGNGGAGISSSISGAAVNYGGGGGAGGFGSAGAGGVGGGGAGKVGNGNGDATDATANTGGGGGGINLTSGGGGDTGSGGSGIVIISYPTGTITATGGTVTTVGGNTIHTFTTDGSFIVTDSLSTGTVYYVQNIVGNTFQISAGPGGTPIDITEDFTGTLSTFIYGVEGPIAYWADDTGGLAGVNSLFITDENAHVWAIFATNVASILANHLIFMGNIAGVADSFEPVPNGLAVWEGYLFLLGSESVGTDVAKLSDLLFDTTAAWTYTWQHLDTIASNDTINTLVSQDFNNLYWTSNLGIDSLTLNTSPTSESLTTSLSMGATGATLSSAWTGSTVNLLVIFSNGDERQVTFTNGSAGITWSGPLSSSASDTISIITTAFNPGDPTSYSVNPAAVTITGNDHATCIGQLGQNLLIGGQGSFVYVWNQIDPSFTGMLNMPDSYTSKIVATSQNAYIFAGIKGKIYITNGSGIDLFKKIPDYLTGQLNSFFRWDDANFGRNQLYFSFRATDAAGTIQPTVSGAWAMDLDSNALRMLNKTSEAAYAGTTRMVVQRPPSNSGAPAIGVVGNNLAIGWYDNSGDAIDVSSALPYDDYSTFIQTEMIPVGTFLDVFTPSQIEWKTSAPLVAGESIRISFRQNITESFVEIGESTSSTGKISDLYKANFQKVQWAQFLIELKSTHTNPSLVRLTEMRIRDWPSGKNMAAR